MSESPSSHGLAAGGWDSAPRRAAPGAFAGGGMQPAGAGVPDYGLASRFPTPAAMPPVDRRVAWYRSPIGLIVLLVVAVLVGGAFLVRPRLDLRVGRAPDVPAPTLRWDAVEVPTRLATVTPGFRRVAEGGISVTVPSSWRAAGPTPQEAVFFEAQWRALPDDVLPDGPPDDVELVLVGVAPNLTSEVNITKAPPQGYDAEAERDAARARLEKLGVQNVTSGSTTVAGRPALFLRADRYAPNGRIIRIAGYAFSSEAGTYGITFFTYDQTVPPPVAEIIGSIVVD